MNALTAPIIPNTARIVGGSLLVGATDYVAAFVQARMASPVVQRIGFGPCVAIGVVRKPRDGGDISTLVGGAVFHNFMPHAAEVSIAFDDPRWCTRPVLRGLFGYAFDVAGWLRLTSITAADNHRVNKLCHGVGWTLEGRHKHGLAPGVDCISWGMTRDECRWIGVP